MDERRLRDAWTRADNAKTRELKAHEQAICFYESAATRLDALGDPTAATSARVRAEREWHRLQTARHEHAETLAARLPIDTDPLPNGDTMLEGLDSGDSGK